MSMHHVKLKVQLPEDIRTMADIVKQLQAGRCTDAVMDFTELRYGLLNLEFIRNGSSIERVRAQVRDQVMFCIPGSRVLSDVTTHHTPQEPRDGRAHQRR